MSTTTSKVCSRSIVAYLIYPSLQQEIHRVFIFASSIIRAQYHEHFFASAIQCMTRTTTTKSFRNFTERRRYLPSCEAIVLKSVSCVTFFSERLEPNIYISQAFGRAVLKKKKHGGQLKIFLLGRKNEPEEIYKKKNTLSQRAVSRCKPSK